MPTGTAPAFGPLLAAFLVALGAGLLSGAPGGVGPFELCMMTLLTSLPEADLIAAILAFRLVYYALPACLAIGVLARPSRVRSRGQASGQGPELPFRAPVKAEAGLARQTGDLVAAPGATFHMAKASQTLVAIGDPVSGDRVQRRHLEWLSRTAGASDLWPALYKCGVRSARTARKHGWAVLPISQEAWIVPAGFSTSGAAHRQLRRKLRRADRSNVVIERAITLPIADMARIAQSWAEANGGERGFSMGRFDPAYLGQQRCYLAWRDETLIAFASFHTAENEWALDLMRSGRSVPDGTMHALVAHAIDDAGQMGIDRLSLAAMPLADPPRLLRRLANRREALGLRQFKTSFAPQQRTLYLAAPTPLALLLAGIDILLRIGRPEKADISALCKPGILTEAPIKTPETMQ